MEQERPATGGAREIWAKTRLRVWPERYVLASLPRSRVVEAARLLASNSAGFAALVVERDEASLTIVEAAWRASELASEGRAAGPFRAITFDIDVELDVCGYLAPVALRLAEAGVSIVPQCAFSKDHLLVHEEKLEAAVGVLEGWMRECREASP